MEHDANLSIDDIISVFREFDGIYQKEMVEAAIERRAEIVPHLIAVLRQVIADPDEHIKDQDLYDHVYALMLLGHFKAAEAHDTIVELFSLPDPIPHDLFGDITTETLPIILLNTCGGSLTRIKAMVQNRKVNDYCRSSALQALAYAVAAEIVPRQEVVSFLGTLFSGNEAEEESVFWSFAADTVLELYPEENMTVIENAYEKDLILDGTISRDDFARALESDPAAHLEQLKAKLQSDSLDDLHTVMSGWSCFKSDLDFLPASGPDDLIASGLFGAPSPPSTSPNDKAKKKKKRKQAKASKRTKRR